MTTTLQPQQQTPALVRQKGWPPVGPNWFAAVMGTGIVAVAGAGLPLHNPAINLLTVGAWGLAAVILLAVTSAYVVAWAVDVKQAKEHLRHPVMRHFHGAIPMAYLTVGAGTLLVGQQFLGELAVNIDLVLWAIGTVLGVVTAVLVPVFGFLNQSDPSRAFGGWLMPVVPPMVSAATGALLIEHLPAGDPRIAMLVGGYAMVGISGLSSLIIITQIWRDLVHHGVGPAAMVPTVWIVLGPLGQSVTAIGLLTHHTPGVLPGGETAVLAGTLLGAGIWGFAVIWFAIAATITIKTLRTGLPFALTWWSFTFPIGTLVTGTTVLYNSTGLTALSWTAVTFYGVLVFAWATVLVKTGIYLVKQITHRRVS